MKKIISILLFSIVAVAALPHGVMAQLSPSEQIQGGVNSIGGNPDALACKDTLGRPAKCTLGLQIRNVVSVLMFLLGAIAVIMIIIGGIRYTTSNGDSASIKSAKDTILYAVVGLVVAILAYAIVNFILSAF